MFLVVFIYALCMYNRCRLEEVVPVAYTENFHGGVSFSGIWWSFVFGERCL